MAQNSRPVFRSPSLEQETVEELSRRLLEITAQLNASNRSLQHLQQERTEMLANLSHDLRAPLTAIRSARGLSYFRTVSVCTGYRRCPHPDRSPDWDTGTSDPGYVRVVHSGGSFPRLFLSGTGCPGLSGRIFLYRTSGQPLCRSSSLFICIAGSPCHPFCRSRKTDTDSGQSAQQCRKICSRRNENHSVCRAFR